MKIPRKELLLLRRNQAAPCRKRLDYRIRIREDLKFLLTASSRNHPQQKILHRMETHLPMKVLRPWNLPTAAETDIIPGDLPERLHREAYLKEVLEKDPDLMLSDRLRLARLFCAIFMLT